MVSSARSEIYHFYLVPCVTCPDQKEPAVRFVFAAEWGIRSFLSRQSQNPPTVGTLATRAALRQEGRLFRVRCKKAEFEPSEPRELFRESFDAGVNFC